MYDEAAPTANKIGGARQNLRSSAVDDALRQIESCCLANDQPNVTACQLGDPPLTFQFPNLGPKCAQKVGKGSTFTVTPARLSCVN